MIGPAVAVTAEERAMRGLVRLLMAAYPAAFRDTFAREIQEVVYQQWRERAHDRRTRRRFLVHMALDLTRHAVEQRAGQIRRGIEGAHVRQFLSKIESWAETWTILTSSIVWIAFVASLADPGFEWGLFGVDGSGIDRAFISLCLLTLLALSLPFSNAFGSDWVRRGLRAVWLGFWTVKLVGSLAHHGSGSAFEGAAWGIRVSVLWFLVPTAAFTVVAILRLAFPKPQGLERGAVPWTSRGLGLLAAIALVPLQLALFAAGDGRAYGPRLAIVLTIVQWILLWRAAGRPPRPLRGGSANAETERRSPSHVGPASSLPFEVSQ